MSDCQIASTTWQSEKNASNSLPGIEMGNFCCFPRISGAAQVYGRKALIQLTIDNKFALNRPPFGNLTCHTGNYPTRAPALLARYPGIRDALAGCLDAVEFVQRAVDD